MKSVPVIDIEPFRSGRDKAGVAAEVAKACETVGFLVIAGHGVDKGLVERLLDVSKRFFALPEEVKARYVSPRAEVFRGFFPFANQALAASTGEASPPDLRESFLINRVGIDHADPYFADPAKGTAYSPNIWPDPDLVPDFREAYETYYQEMERLASTLMRIFALALDLPEDWFEEKIARHFTNMSVFHYPPLSAPPRQNAMRGGPHTDFGSLTIVRGSPSIRGLQVFTEGEWEDVPDIADSFVVNIGDLMAQWTNDRWISTLHRVVNPVEAEWDRARHSIVFFHQPNYDALIGCLESCQSPGRPPKYAPETSGAHLFRKLMSMNV
jgi:isopenicillin N synthase-like dioxygenase